jgi:hypothetical protein
MRWAPGNSTVFVSAIIFKMLNRGRTSADARDTGLAQTLGNVTNLALKGIIALQAMSEISQIIGQAADAEKYGVAQLRPC